MIKVWGRSRSGDKRVLVLGLSDGNLQRLREDKPIGAELGLPHDIVICWGETESKIADKLGYPGATEPVKAKRNYQTPRGGAARTDGRRNAGRSTSARKSNRRVPRGLDRGS